MKRNILKIRLMGALLCLALICLGSAAWGANYVLSLQTSDGSKPTSTFLQGQDLYLHIVINDMTGVAGAAFTLNYPSAVLLFEGTDAAGLSTGVYSPVFNFVQGTATSKTHRENGATAGKLLLSGAAINTSGVSCVANPDRGGSAYEGDQTLFTIRFKVKADATINNHSFSLGKTSLSNTDAGYAAGGEEIPVLIGAVPCSDTANWGNLSAAFPPLDGSLTWPPAAENFAVIDGSLNVDGVPPTGSIAFVEGAYTKTAAVTLKLTAADNLGIVTAMKVSNTNPADWKAVLEKPYATTLAWTLAAGDGLKTVFARFKDAAGNWSAVVSDDITLDTKAPVTAPDWPAGGYKAWP